MTCLSPTPSWCHSKASNQRVLVPQSPHHGAAERGGGDKSGTSLCTYKMEGSNRSSHYSFVTLCPTGCLRVLPWAETIRWWAKKVEFQALLFN